MKYSRECTEIRGQGGKCSCCHSPCKASRRSCGLHRPCSSNPPYSHLPWGLTVLSQEDSSLDNSRTGTGKYTSSSKGLNNNGNVSNVYTCSLFSLSFYSFLLAQRKFLHFSILKMFPQHKTKCEQ